MTNLMSPSDCFKVEETLNDYTKLCKLKNFSGHTMLFEIDNKKFLLIRSGEEFFFINNACCHMGGPLNKGKFFGDEVECPWHGCRYNFKTGVSTNSKNKLSNMYVPISRDMLARTKLNIN